jgi:DNA-binding transcriptional MerR regulator
VSESWILPELVEAAAKRIAALPPPKNGQVRAVPDERTVRYYAAIGLLDRPSAVRGRTALYDARHLAQIVAIKRLQGAGRSLGDIPAMWPTLEDDSLARMSGVKLAAKGRAARAEFWKREPSPSPSPSPSTVDRKPRTANLEPGTGTATVAFELRLPIAPGAAVSLTLDSPPSLSPADLRALRAAAAPLVAELARRGLIASDRGTLEETP